MYRGRCMHIIQFEFDVTYIDERVVVAIKNARVLLMEVQE